MHLAPALVGDAPLLALDFLGPAPAARDAATEPALVWHCVAWTAKADITPALEQNMADGLNSLRALPLVRSLAFGRVGTAFYPVRGAWVVGWMGWSWQRGCGPAGWSPWRWVLRGAGHGRRHAGVHALPTDVVRRRRRARGVQQSNGRHGGWERPLLLGVAHADDNIRTNRLPARAQSAEHVKVVAECTRPATDKVLAADIWEAA